MRIRLNDSTLGVHNPDAGQEHARIVPSLADYGIDPYVPNGTVIDVPADVAGAAPFWRKAKPGDEVAFMESRHDTDPKVGTTVHDLGHGLLAQTDVWVRADDDSAGSEK